MECLPLALAETHYPEVYFDAVSADLGARMCEQLRARGHYHDVVGYLAEARVSGIDVTIIDAMGYSDDPMCLSQPDRAYLSGLVKRHDTKAFSPLVLASA